MRKPTVFILFMLALTISWAVADDKPNKANKPKAAHQVTQKNPVQNIRAVETKIEQVIAEQKNDQKRIKTLTQKIDQQAAHQKSQLSDVTEKIELFQQNISKQVSRLSKNTQGLQSGMITMGQNIHALQTAFQAQQLTMNQNIQALSANIESRLSEVTQDQHDWLETIQSRQAQQIHEITLIINHMKSEIAKVQANQYSAMDTSGNSLNQQKVALAKMNQQLIVLSDDLTQLQSQLSGSDQDINQVLAPHFKAQDDSISSIETNLKNLINNSQSQLNSDISTKIRDTKTELNRFRQNIDDSLQQVNSGVMEIKHEQQIELQSMVKQLTKEINRLDQNISDSLSKTAQTLNHTHLTWVIYGLVGLIIGLILYIVWDRNATVVPLIERIQKLENNLVIEY